jgi:hypothetical protein
MFQVPDGLRSGDGKAVCCQHHHCAPLIFGFQLLGTQATQSCRFESHIVPCDERVERGITRGVNINAYTGALAKGGAVSMFALEIILYSTAVFNHMRL